MSGKLSEELERLGADVLVVLGAHGEDADLAAFAGAAKLGDAFVVAPRGGAPRLAYLSPMEREEAAATGLALLAPEQLDVGRIARERPQAGAFLAAVLARGLEQAGVAPGRVALAGSWPAGVLVEACAELGGGGWSFVSGSEAMRRARKAKRAGELAEIRRVTTAVGEAFAAVARLLAAASVRAGELWVEGERLRVARLKREVALLFAGHGLSQPRANIVSPAEEGAVPHTAGTPERVLRASEALIVDLFPKGLLFSDATRTFCVGSPPEPLARAHGDVREALRRAHSGARAGAHGWDLQQATCALLGERGWPTPVSAPGTLRGYVHGLGHGVGYELHELPSFRKEAGEDARLAEGDVITIEPGLYEPGPGGFGVRLEDLVWLGPEGPENLTPWPHELDPNAWAGGQRAAPGR